MAKKLNINKEHSLKGLTSVAEMTLPLTTQILGQRGFIQMDLLSSWQSVVGVEIAQYSLPQKIVFPKNSCNNGCLTIIVPAGAFALELSQNKQKIIDKINTYFGYPAVADIKIIQNSAPQDIISNKKSIDKVKKTVVSAKEESYITKLTEGIEHSELREAIQNLGRFIIAHNKKQE